MNRPMTLQEIAKVEGISRQAVTEILERAYKKLLKEFEKRGITLGDLV